MQSILSICCGQHPVFGIPFESSLRFCLGPTAANLWSDLFMAGMLFWRHLELHFRTGHLCHLYNAAGLIHTSWSRLAACATITSNCPFPCRPCHAVLPCRRLVSRLIGRPARPVRLDVSATSGPWAEPRGHGGWRPRTTCCSTAPGSGEAPAAGFGACGSYFMSCHGAPAFTWRVFNLDKVQTGFQRAF